MKLEIERMKYEKMYSDALAERDILNDIVEKSSIREKTRQVISDRLEVLNKVIISHITDTSLGREARKIIHIIIDIIHCTTGDYSTDIAARAPGGLT